MAIFIRHVLVVVIVFAVIFVTLRLTSDDVFTTTELLTSLRNSLTPSHDFLSLAGDVTWNPSERANATFVILCRNSDLAGAIHSVRSIEDRFNRKHGYPYVFLNEEPFDEEFERRISVLSDAKMEFGLIPHDHWHAPAWIDEKRAAESRKKMEEDNIIYGGSLPYRNMCRFNSGFFFRHTLLAKYRYYWRIEPWVHYHCNIPSDPFLFMQTHNKSYGFTLTMREYEATIPSLWETTREYIGEHPETLNSQNSLEFISEDTGITYNMCHFWSNFEIADMDFWRGEVYMSYFDYLDRSGGFYYERWGDAPIHSIAAALFLPQSSIHFFDEIGYEHPPFTHCPADRETWENGKCSCSQGSNFDEKEFSCLWMWKLFRGDIRII